MITMPRLSNLNPSAPFEGQVIVSPEDAKCAMAININNRRVRTQLVNYLKMQIDRGEWQSDHPQPLVFSVAGRLIDGQHRLIAISEGKTTVIARVICGARDELREYLDTGVARTLEDRVSFDPHPSINKHVAALVNLSISLKGNRFRRSSPAEAMDYFIAHKPSLMFAAAYMTRNVRAVCRSAVWVAMSEFWERSDVKAEQFASSLVVSDGIVQQARMLRDWLLRQSSNGMSATRDAYAKTICAAKAFMEDRELKMMRSAEW